MKFSAKRCGFGRLSGLWLSLAGLLSWPALAGLAAEADATPHAIAQLHFVGGNRLFEAIKGTPLESVAKSPEWALLTAQTFEKLSLAPHDLLRQRAAGTNDFSMQIRPLVEDVLNAESLVELRDGADGTPELCLALRLDANRARLWETNLGSALSAWSGVAVRPVTVEQCAGWEVRKHHRPNLFRAVFTGHWLVLGLGQDELPTQQRMVSRLKQPFAYPEKSWLDAEIDVAGVLGLLKKTEVGNVSKVKVSWAPGGHNLRVLATLTDPISVSGPWLAPSNLIHGTLLSFTATRNLDSILKMFSVKDQLPGLSNQAFAWTISQHPLGGFFAAPVSDGSAVLKEVSPKLETLFRTKLHLPLPGEINAQSNRVTWEGVPLVRPYFEVVREPGSEFITGGLIQNNPTPTSVPPRFLSRMREMTNMVHYHWEQTRQRAERWQSVAQLLLAFSGRPASGTNSASLLLLGALGPKLGETETEVSLVGSRQLLLERQGFPGLTGLELIGLANWLELTNFPWGGYELPSRARPGGGQ